MIKHGIARFLNIISTTYDIKLVKKVLGQEKHFCTRLPYVHKTIRERLFSMINTTYNSTEDIIDKLQRLKAEPN